MHPESQYLDLVKEILDQKGERDDRTGVGTLSCFASTMSFDLSESFPLFTTKKVFWRAVVEELLWILGGHTNANLLKQKGIKIWEGNSSREYLDSVGLKHLPEGDIGAGYGFQLRHFGAKYVDMNTDYTGQGVDQLADLIHKIKTDPTSRRLVISMWNPADLNNVALPACHMFCQFYVHKGTLSCQMYQRSCDMGLGVPFNVASYALLTCMLAHVTGLKPKMFRHVMGDVHVYKNHVDAMREQIKREPRPFPTLKIVGDVKDIDSFTFDSFKLEGYDPHPPIKMEMAV